jgi:hypothetical protein
VRQDLCIRVGLMSILAGVAAAQSAPQDGQPVQTTGVFSSLFLHKDTQDVVGYEITVSRVGDDRAYSVVLQCAQGVAQLPIVSKAQLVDGALQFASTDPVCGTNIKAKPVSDGIFLWVDGKSQGLIPRQHSFWENHR